MNANPTADCKKLPRARLRVLALMVFSVFINYIESGESFDRGATHKR
jgi:hypothetical protein